MSPARPGYWTKLQQTKNVNPLMTVSTAIVVIVDISVVSVVVVIVADKLVGFFVGGLYPPGRVVAVVVEH